MTKDVPGVFCGTAEVDETYLGAPKEKQEKESLATAGEDRCISRLPFDTTVINCCNNSGEGLRIKICTLLAVFCNSFKQNMLQNQFRRSYTLSKYHQLVYLA